MTIWLFLAAAATCPISDLEPVRDQYWQCTRETGEVVSQHERLDKALHACQKAADLEPGIEFVVVGARYRIRCGPPPTALLSWEAPTLNVDGSRIAPIRHYTLSKTRVQGDYTAAQDVQIGAAELTYVWEPLSPGQHWWTITVTTDDGVDGPWTSRRSNEVSKTVQ